MTGKVAVIEFGQNKVGRVDVYFLSGPSANGVFYETSEAILLK
jgi:hypothetical protein